MSSSRPSIRDAVCILLVSALGGCSTLPSSGPTAHEIVRDQDGAKLLGFRIIDISAPAVVEMAAAALPAQPSLSQLQADGPVDTIGPGDILSINIFEIGVSLFSGNNTALGGEVDASGGLSGAQNATVTGVVVDRSGTITVPYAGRISVAGKTAVEVQDEIQRRLKGISQNPQALVSVRRNVTNTVMVLGVVARPGSQELTLARPRVLDAIAQAGGTGLQPQEDMVVRVTRNGRSAEELLSSIKSGGSDDLTLLPGDRVQVLRRPQSYTVFGATKVAQVDFENPTLTLAEALARSGGPSDERADPSAVFIFRYARDEEGRPLLASQPGNVAVPPPTIFRLDMMRPVSYFLAQQFAMRDKDVVYIANAASNRPVKLVNIINQLFSPFLIARAAAGNP